MDPFKALAEIDAALQTIPANRATHAHLIGCTQVIRKELEAAAALKLQKVADPAASSDAQTDRPAASSRPALVREAEACEAAPSRPE